MTTQIKTKGTILAVEDDMTTLTILTSLLEELGYTVIEAGNGHEALGVIETRANDIDVIVMDKTMPELGGLEVVERLKNDLKARHIPVVMVTGSKSPDEIKEGVDAGVFYYLTKPYEEDLFKSVLKSALNESSKRTLLNSELQKHWMSFSFIDRAEFTIKNMHEAEDLACFLANCFPNPETTIPGLAALITNAVEHGNLGVGYSKKTQLLKDSKWEEDIRDREELPENANKIVRVILERQPKETKVTIIDQGNGFDWKNYMDIDPARALDNHGRGIAMANKISFDEINYNNTGNEVTAISKRGQGIKW